MQNKTNIVEYLHRQRWYWHCGTVDLGQDRQKLLIKMEFLPKVNFFPHMYVFSITWVEIYTLDNLFCDISLFCLKNLEIQHNLRWNLKFNCKTVGTMHIFQILWILWRNPSNNKAISAKILVSIFNTIFSFFFFVRSPKTILAFKMIGLEMT